MVNIDKFDNHPKHILDKYVEEERQAFAYLRNLPYLTIFLVIFTIVIGQFWFLAAKSFYFELMRMKDPAEPRWYINVMASLAITIWYILIVVVILNIPVHIFI